MTPKLRFPGFTDEWQALPLATLLSVSRAKNDNLEFRKSQVLSVAAEAGVVNQIKYHGRSYAGASVRPYNVLRRGEVVYTKSPLKAYPYGIVKFNEGHDGIVSTLYAVYVVDENASGKFLDYYFYYPPRINKYLKPLVNIGAKNDMKVNNETVLSGLVRLPIFSEQQKIAGFMGGVDEKVASIQRKVAAMHEYKKGVMQALFSGKLRFKDENGNPYPDWQEKKLGEIVTVKMGQSPSSRAYNQNGDGLYLIQGNADISDRLTVPRYWTSEITKTCEVGDIILTVRAPSGYVAISQHKACMGRGVSSITPKSGVNKDFVYQFLLRFEPKWASIEQGSTFTAISGDDIRSVQLKVPSNEEQQKIADFLSVIDAKIELENKKLQQAKQFKKSLLQRMFV